MELDVKPGRAKRRETEMRGTATPPPPTILAHLQSRRQIHSVITSPTITRLCMTYRQPPS